jgi:hypothetical protein
MLVELRILQYQGNRMMRWCGNVRSIRYNLALVRSFAVKSLYVFSRLDSMQDIMEREVTAGRSLHIVFPERNE